MNRFMLWMLKTVQVMGVSIALGLTSGGWLQQDLNAQSESGQTVTRPRVPVVPNSAAEYGGPHYNCVLAGLGDSLSHVRIADPNSDFNILGHPSGTIEAWVYPTTKAHPVFIISKGLQLATLGFAFYIDVDGRLTMRMGHTIMADSGALTVPLNRWTHVAVAWDIIAEGANTSFYIDGKFNSLGHLKIYPKMSPDDVIIGGSEYPLDSKYFFEGCIDEVRWWSSERLEPQIRDNRFVGLGDHIYADKNQALTSSTAYTELVASWTFDGGIYAADMIGGHGGVYEGSAHWAFCPSGTPMPYNLALRTFGGANDYVIVPHSSTFNLYYGTIDMWVNLLSMANSPGLISKGPLGGIQALALGVTPGGYLYFEMGTSGALMNGNAHLATNIWTHIAVTWAQNMQNGQNFDVNFYLNGVKCGTTITIKGPLVTNTDPLRIGRWDGGGISDFPSTPDGWIDEVRVWDAAVPASWFPNIMYASGRSLKLNYVNLRSVWNFDGNLINQADESLSGSFSNGGTNNARLSGFTNETTAGPYGTSFDAHPTVLSRETYLGDFTANFPMGFKVRNAGKNLPFNLEVTDTITISTNFGGPVQGVEVFLSIWHPGMSDLSVILEAPNGQKRALLLYNGAAGRHALTFFGEGTEFDSLPSGLNYLAPWSFLKPPAPMGTFNGSNKEGKWIIHCTNVVPGGAYALLRGWGIRFTDVINLSGPVGASVKGGWNTVSVPVLPDDPSKRILFQRSNSPLYYYNGTGYVPMETLEPGRGYWLKFPADELTDLVGDLVLKDTINVYKGWNLIGSLSSPVDVSNITSLPGGILTSQFFGYNGGYTHALTLEPGKAYWVKVSQDGQLVLSASAQTKAENRIRIVTSNDAPPPAPDKPESDVPVVKVPSEFSLGQNYPNPFNPSTVIGYELPAASHVTLKVYNILGEEVATLVDSFQDAGIKSVTFNASHLPSGVYVYRLVAGSLTQVRRLTLLR